MDFHSMKRKQLQALCKQHKIPANLSNLDMANKLTEFLKEKENPVIREEEERVNEAESNDGGVNRKVKKVRFSPEHELIEFTRVQETKRRSRRKSICRTDSNWPVEIVESGEVNEIEGRRGRSRVTRAGGLKVMDEEINQKRGTKETEGNWPVGIVESGEVNKETEGRRGRSRTRAGESKVMEEEINQKKRGRAPVKRNDGKAISSAVETIDDDKLEEGDVVEPGRVTRLRGKKMEAQGVKNTSTREKQGAGYQQDERVSSDVNNEKDAETRSRVTRSRAQKLTEAPAEVNKRGRRVVKKGGADSLSKKDDESEGMQENGEGLKENLVNKQIAEEHVIVEPPGRTKRKADMVGDSEMINNNPKKHENGAIKDPIKTSKLLPSDGSQMDAEVTERGVNPGRGRRAVHKIEEHIMKVEPRRSNRRKTVVESDVLKAETENRSSSRISVQLPDVVPEISNDEKMILQPTGVTRRGRRKTLGLKLCPAKDTVSIENLEAEKHVSEPCLLEKENSAIEKKSARTRGTFACKPPGKFSDEANTLDTLSHCSSEVGQSLFLDVQLPVKNDPESSCNLCTKDIIADEAGGYCADLTNGEEPGRNSTSDEDQNCNVSEVEKSNSQLGLEPQQSTEKDIADVNKNPETQVYSQMEDSGCINEINNKVVADGLDVSEKEGSDVTCSCSDNLLLGDQIDVETDLKVTDIEADEGSLPCTGVVDHHNDLIHLEASYNILDNSNEDASQTAGEVGIFVSYETDYTHSTGSSKLKGSSSSMTRPHGDNVAEENETLSHKGTEEMAEADEDGCSNDCGNISNHICEFNMLGLVNGKTCEGESSKGHMSTCEDGEFSLANLFDAEGTYGIIPQDTEKFSSETRKVESSRGHRSKCEEDVELSLAYLFDAEGKYGITPQDRKKFPGETREADSSEGHMSKGDEDGDFSFANLFDAEGRYDITPQDGEKVSGEHLVMDFVEQGNGFTSVELRDLEGTVSVGGRSNYKSKMSESTEADESGRLESHKSSNDDDWGFNVSNQRDGDKNTRIEPQNLPSASKVEDLDEQGLSPVLPAVSTVFVNCNGVKFGTDSLNCQETNPSTPSSISVTQDEQKSQSAKSNTLVNSNHRQAAWSKASEPAGNEMCFSKSYDDGKISLVTEGFNADEDDKDDSAGTSNSKYCLVSSAKSSSDMKFQDLMETEHQNKDSLSRLTELHAGEEATHATQRKSWTEIALHNLFETTLDRDASPGLDDTFREGSEIENMTTSKNKSNTNNGGSLTRQKGKEMEGDNRNECAEAKYKDMVSPTSCKDDTCENELKFLFATPVKITTPCKIEEAHSHDRVLDSSVTLAKECSDTMKENVATETMPDKKTQNAEYEVENSSCNGVLLSDNGGGDDICKEINEVERFSSRNTSNGVFPGHIYDGREVMQDQMAQNKEECLKETNLVTGEDKEENVISLAESCLQAEATEKNIISSSGSTWDLYELESRADMSETEGEMVQNAEVVVESRDIDLQKSNVPENSHLLTAGSDHENIMREISVETSSDPEEAKIGSFQKNVTDKGESLFLFSNASPDCEDSTIETDDHCEAKTLDEKYDIPKLSQDTSDELTNSGVAIQNGVSIGHSTCQEMDQLPSSDELEDTYEAKGMGTTSQIQYTTDAVAEHESYVSGDVSGFLHSSAMPSFLEYQEKGDTNLEARELSDNDGNGTCEEMNNVECVKAEDTSTTVLSKTEYDGFEAFEEQLIENSVVCEQETDFMNEDNEKNVNSLGKSYLSYKGTNSDSESAEETTISLSGSPNILDKLKGCPDMLIETSLSESLSYSCSVDHNSEQKMAQSCEATLEFSDADNQKINHLTGWFADIYEETPFHTCPLVAEVVNVSSFDGQSADKGTSLHHSSNVSPVNDKLTQREDTDDLNGVEICDVMDAKAKSSKDMMSDEPQINSAVEILKTLPDTDDLCEEADKLHCSVELQSAFLEAKETESTVQDTITIVAPTVSGCNEMLKESDVADTIKEYIESESSMSAIFENTDSLSGDIDAHTYENSALSKCEDDTAGRVANSKNEDNTTISVDCFETEIKEQEKAPSFIETAQGSGNATNSAGWVGLFNEGSVKLDSHTMVESETGRSIMKKNARTILIHGTPNKLLTMTDMKENAPTQKNSNVGDVTAARPAKRRALQNVQWK